MNHILFHVKKINGKQLDFSVIKAHISIFERNSFHTVEIIRRMELAVKRQKPKAILLEAQAALQKGLYPVLAARGRSGGYWMRGMDRQILGLFKPFDEEPFAPNNPLGPSWRGALGLRRLRDGCRVGESPHHEVAAYLVDEYLGFGIVPKTYYAQFTHHVFFSAHEDPRSFSKANRTKLGSFQEFVEGLTPLEQLTQKEMLSISLEDFQLLIVLDLILGNMDRNVGNILFCDGKIVAIDHGLCFPDQMDDLSYFGYWSLFPQGRRSLFSPILEMLNNFPFEELSEKLHGKCFISLEALQCMRERVVLFTEAMNAGLVPSQVAPLFTSNYLRPLRQLKTTLQKAAAEQVRRYLEY